MAGTTKILALTGHAKGDKVTFRHPKTNVVTKGVVEKGGRKIVQVVTLGKPEESFKGSVYSFTPAEFDIPVDPAVTSMDGYEVRRYQEYPRLSDETTAHNATICFKGKAVVEISNDGHGGSDMIDAARGCAFDVVDAFSKAVKAWWAECGGGEDPFEVEGLWVGWYVHERPYGITARQSVMAFVETMQELTHHRL